ncbi:MAG TPA: PepSY domain-containing protein [Geothrix sp.]|nr:PepSY domain-containing protein [Geothrix sp.]
MRVTMMMVAALIGSTLVISHGRAHEAAEGTKVEPALASAMKEAKISLARGLQASEKEGKAISGKFELDGGKLQLSVYTTKGSGFFEVIVDFTNGKVLKTEPISDGEDLAAAKKQAELMVKSKHTLYALAGKAEKANPGYRVISITPDREHGEAHADLVLLKGAESKHVEENL